MIMANIFTGSCGPLAGGVFAGGQRKSSLGRHHILLMSSVDFDLSSAQCRHGERWSGKSPWLLENHTRIEAQVGLS